MLLLLVSLLFVCAVLGGWVGYALARYQADERLYRAWEEAARHRRDSRGRWDW